MHSAQPIIVVGVSGSAASVAALRWAAAEAGRRNALLRVVRSWQVPERAPYAPCGGQLRVTQLRAIARRELADAVSSIFASGAPANIETAFTEGCPERTLIDQSLDADLLVLGAHPAPSPSEPSVGPVVRVCLGRAYCPVVVIRMDVCSGADQRPAGRAVTELVRA